MDNKAGDHQGHSRKMHTEQEAQRLRDIDTAKGFLAVNRMSEMREDINDAIGQRLDALGLNIDVAHLIGRVEALERDLQWNSTKGIYARHEWLCVQHGKLEGRVNALESIVEELQRDAVCRQRRIP